MLVQFRNGCKHMCVLLEVTDPAAFARAFDDIEDLVTNRLKLIPIGVKVKVPVPTKGPRSADTVQYFFGKDAVRVHRCALSPACELAVVDVDLCASWLVRFGIKRVRLSLGAILDFDLVDWRGEQSAVLASIRLTSDEAAREHVAEIAQKL